MSDTTATANREIEGLGQWIAEFGKGLSARAIAAHLGGVWEQTGNYPSDADDFRRCERLLDMVPEFRDRLGEMAEVNAYWRALVPLWTSLSKASGEALTAQIRAVVVPIELRDPSIGQMQPGVSVRAGGAITFQDEQLAGDQGGNEQTYRVTADELRQFIERFERLEHEKKEIADQQKEVMAEAKARGYDTAVMRKVIALRKRDRDEIAEEEAVLEMYKEALGM